VCKFRGPGTIYVQSRNPEGYQEWLKGQLQGQQNGGGKAVPCCIFLLVVVIIICVFAMIAMAIYLNNDPESDFKLSSNQRRR